MGLAWRRRGNILVEKGALDAAESAYRTSVKYDPKNRIAHSELATIEKMRRERRSRTPDPVVTAVLPVGMTVAECAAPNN
jgi:predicted TPR repeat methyltransferase